MPRAWPLLAALCLSAGGGPGGPGGPSGPGGPDGEAPARRLALELTSAPRLAGTVGSLRSAQWVAARLEEAGWQVAIEPRVVALSLPRRIAVRAVAGGTPLFERVERFDPDAVPPGDVPKYSAWTASGRVRARVVDVGRGLRADHERTRAAGRETRGAIVLASYGGAYRGVKAALAEEAGCAGVLLYSPLEEEGAGRGPVWPEGPWKPGWAAQRGSILPLATCPGDPTTPGWPSPAPGVSGRRLSDAERDARLPRIPCTPLGVDEAQAIRAALAAGQEVEVELDLEVPRELRTIHDVVARLPGREPGLVLAGNHRDSWVRGAHDAGSGTVSLLRAAQRLGERARAGWTPRHTLVLGFWDAEESGLIGSTEWGEAHADELREHAIAYVNADAVVSGTRFHASGAPGLVGALRRALARVPAPADQERAAEGPARSLDDVWAEGAGGGGPRLGLAGSGSDHAVFLHHLGVPVIDVSFSGNAGGQYHTRFDDFAVMDRFLDPTWEGHETAGHLLAELLVELADGERRAFDDAEAARELARHVREAGAERGGDGTAWLGPERAERLAGALETLAASVERVLGSGGHAPRTPDLYRALEAPEGLPGRPWYRNRIWAPGLESGYAAETLPTLRLAATRGEEALARELDGLVAAVQELTGSWVDRARARGPLPPELER